MALFFDGTDGNFNVTLAGVYNASGGGSYTPLFSAATALTVALTIRPTSLDATPRHLAHCGAETGGSQSWFIKHRGDVAPGTLRFHLWDENFNGRNAISQAGVLRAGEVNCLLFRWRASDNLIQCQVGNTVGNINVPLTLGGTGIPRLGNNTLANNAPLEMGAASGDDAFCVPGTYQQWAIWTTYASDADAALYGATGDPSRMSIAATARYWVTLAQASITPIDPPGTYGSAQGVPSPAIGHIRDVNTGVDYAATTATYNYGGGNFTQPCHGTFGGTVVADLAPPQVTMIPDAPSLPVEWFEAEELNGHCGQRHLVNGQPVKLLVPSQYGELYLAMAAAQYGDDIVIDHTATIPAVDQRYFPQKTFNAATPRMSPHQKRPLTQSRARTSAR